jgi:hypothetical protein
MLRRVAHQHFDPDSHQYSGIDLGILHTDHT